MRKFLRFLGILFLGITAALTLLSGVGTTCVALNPSQYQSMKALAPFQALYIFFVLAAVATGILGIRATIRLSRGKENSTRSALFVLLVGLITGGAHMITSRLLRGSSMPTDFIVYFTALTLILFLIFQIPKVREFVDFEKSTGNPGETAGGLAALVSGLLFLSVHIWAGPSHLLGGFNYASAFQQTMNISGGFLILAGLGLITKATLFQEERSFTKSPLT